MKSNQKPEQEPAFVMKDGDRFYSILSSNPIKRESVAVLKYGGKNRSFFNSHYRCDPNFSLKMLVGLYNNTPLLGQRPAR